jgi:hypothetical protein
VQRIGLTHVVPVDGRGRRTLQTQLQIYERDKLLVEAAKYFPGASDCEIARRLHIALVRYRNGRWRRDGSEATCPVQHCGKLMQALWCLLKTRDAIPGERTIRAVLSRTSIRCPASDGSSSIIEIERHTMTFEPGPANPQPFSAPMPLVPSFDVSSCCRSTAPTGSGHCASMCMIGTP